MITVAQLQRLKSQLLTSGLQERNNALFQVIDQLIDAVRQGFGQANTDISTAATDAAAAAAAAGSGTPNLGALLFQEEGGSDEIIAIPGPVGPTGVAGAAGASGAPGPILFLNEPEDPDWWPPIPGPQGNPGTQGIQGNPGPALFVEDGVDGADGQFGPVPSIPARFSNTYTNATFQDTFVDLFNSQIALGIGDVIYFEVHGLITNNTGATRLYGVQVTLGSKTLELQSAAASANTAITAVHLRGTITLISTSSSIWILKGRMNPTSTAGTAATDTERTIFTTDTVDYSGLKTMKLSLRATVTGASSDFKGSYYIERRPPMTGGPPYGGF